MAALMHIFCIFALRHENGLHPLKLLLMNLNAEFIERTETLFGKAVYDRFAQALDEEPVVSIRHNELKHFSGIDGDNAPVTWARSTTMCTAWTFVRISSGTVSPPKR